MNRPLACLFVALALTSAAAAKDLVGVYEDALRSDPQIRQADANRLASRERMPTGEKYSIGPRRVGPMRHTKCRPASSAPSWWASCRSTPACARCAACCR